MMTKEKILNKATKILRDFYAEHKTDGILGIYLWGSITTDNFDPKKSDIDSVGGQFAYTAEFPEGV